MKKIISIFLIIISFFYSGNANGAQSNMERSGYILLQVEKNGEAWYVYPGTQSRYYLGRPVDAFSIMKKLALGAKHDFIANTDIFPTRLSGMILLDVEQNGEAYYIYPKDNKKYFLGRPTDAFQIMRELGQGISNTGLSVIPVGDINKATPVPSTEIILQKIPFTSQAPFGQWSDLRQEDGCEEASSLMAVSWARGQSFTKEEALKQITGISDWELNKYGEYRDISITDTINWIIKDYFNFQNVALKKDITTTDIIDELKKGNIIIAQMNGQQLHNPNYTAPGPTHHMLVVRGYDPLKNEFITNDPGTRKGELYRYNTDVFFKAIRVYPTGNLLPVDKIVKDVIVVWK